ncbi:hypothetical protein PVAND_007129 [Polypedilum vanderplanki]|uniref:Uncharacterized protein n=1 Tax=Polypedilum vanderplanki TaxID=319348 RepID=A0A9J6C624_POLVA|nr:hypothetical protein PVAND_007129 [Polypedilum vanderplanki]
MQSKIFKSYEKSIHFLNEAKELKTQLKHMDAIIALNKSLCYSVSDSQLSMAFAERAKIFYDLKKYKECQENLKWAKSHGNNNTELAHFETACINQLKSLDINENDKPWNFFKLSPPLNKKLPFISDCLKLHESFKYGRYIKTNRPLHTGEVIAIEEPLFKMPNKDVRYKRCSNCLKSNQMNLLPCSQQKCVSTMYCSIECMQLGWKRYHKYECSFLEESLENNEYDLMIQRIIFETLDMFDGNIEKLKTLLSETKDNQSIYDFDLSNKNDIENKKLRLKSIYALKRGKCSEEDKAMADWFVESDSTLKHLCKTKAQQDFLKNFILRMMGIMDRNSYIFYSLASVFSEKDEEIGTGLFSFASLLNHSCSPNLYRFFVDNKQIYVVKKPIEAGQQLFVGYLSNFTLCEREKRQADLFQDFSFHCTCDACVQNFPLMKDLKRCDENFKEELPTLSRYSISDAKKIYEYNCKYIETNINKFPFPCYEICFLMQSSFRLLHFIANKPFLPE